MNDADRENLRGRINDEINARVFRVTDDRAGRRALCQLFFDVCGSEGFVRLGRRNLDEAREDVRVMAEARDPRRQVRAILLYAGFPIRRFTVDVVEDRQGGTRFRD